MRGHRMRRTLLRVVTLIAVVTTIVISTTYWLGCGSLTQLDDNFYREGKPYEAGRPGAFQAIDCIVNGDYKVGCRQEGAEIYLPFNFISKYFEVYGKLVTAKSDAGVSGAVFDWRHSYATVYLPVRPYSPHGGFMSFEHYNVESRDRVKCISGTEGVPLSTQWGAQGYYYPIQIAQYGLSHFSKYLVSRPPVFITVEDAEAGNADRWTVPTAGSDVQTMYDGDKLSRVIEFHTPMDSAGVTIQLTGAASTYGYIGFSVLFTDNASITVSLKLRSQPTIYKIHYSSSTQLIESNEHSVLYGIGARHQWGHISRDLSMDVHKGLTRGKHKRRLAVAQVISVTLRGSGRLDNLTLSNTSAHLDAFYAAANWLVRHQGTNGGWPVPVTRSLVANALVLSPGWHSAMAQGQAMSLLVRAFSHSSDRRYLAAALRATALLNVTSANGGVLAMFDRHPWYEEYPTTPASFVLNGFMYALIGLYDVSVVAPVASSSNARRLYNAGITSLRTLLPLFDSGTGSLYDLRHYAIGVAPNRARWDYHATHINQLLLLASVNNDDGEEEDEEEEAGERVGNGAFFKSVATRWIGYMNGKRSPHN